MNQFFVFLADNWMSISGMTGIIGSMVYWWNGRKREKADTMSTIQAVYQKMVEDVEMKLEKMQENINDLQNSYNSSLDQIKELQNEIDSLRQQSDLDKKTIEQLQKKLMNAQKRIKELEQINIKK